MREGRTDGQGQEEVDEDVRRDGSEDGRKGGGEMSREGNGGTEELKCRDRTREGRRKGRTGKQPLAFADISRNSPSFRSLESENLRGSDPSTEPKREIY